MDDPIRIFVGTDERMEKSDLVLEHTVRKHASQPVEITWMRAEVPPDDGWKIGRKPRKPYSGQGWATDFTCFRWSVPERAGFEGRAIYLDTDMLLLGDIAELWRTKMTHPMMTPGRPDVILFDCAAFKSMGFWPSIEQMKRSGSSTGEYRRLLAAHGKIGKVSKDWNCIDGRGFSEHTKLVHYSNMRVQPWKPWPEAFKYPLKHPDLKMDALFWKEYEEARHASA